MIKREDNTMKFLAIRDFREKNFIINPVRGGSPPSDNIVRIIRTILVGDIWAVALR